MAGSRPENQRKFNCLPNPCSASTPLVSITRSQTLRLKLCIFKALGGRVVVFRESPDFDPTLVKLPIMRLYKHFKMEQIRGRGSKLKRCA
jgi:hypothetical protein